MKEDNDEITLKEAVSRVKQFVLSILTKWPKLLIAGVVGAVIALVVVSFTKPSYTAKLTFVLSSESKSGGLSSLASQFGLDLGGSSGNDVFAGDNILSLFKSEKMIGAVLFKNVPTGNQSLINLIVKDWNWDKKWQKNERTANSFPFPADRERLSPVQDSLLREVCNRIVDDFLTVSRLDKKLTVYELTTKSANEVFACYLTKYLMDETAQFYIDTKTSVSKKNLQMLQREADSLRGLLGRSITNTAASVDRTFNLNSALQVERATTQKSQANATVVGTAYGEVVKNLEIAKITLQKETPLYQIIDEPELPLKAKSISKLLAIVIGFFVGIFLSTAIILIKRI
jgi:capsular polysaccharide biosynthesis protein